MGDRKLVMFRYTRFPVAVQKLLSAPRKFSLLLGVHYNQKLVLFQHLCHPRILLSGDCFVYFTSQSYEDGTKLPIK